MATDIITKQYKSIQWREQAEDGYPLP